VTTKQELNSLEHDIERTRERVDTTLDAIQRKLSPNEIMEQSMAYIRSGGGADFARNLGQTVRDNPLPVALIGAGIAWLVVSDIRRSRTSNGHYHEPLYGEDLHPELRSHGEEAALEGYEWEEDSHDAAVPGRTRRVYEDLATRADEAAAGMKQRSDETSEAFQERVAHARAQVLGYRKRAEENFASFKDRVERGMMDARERYRRFRDSAAQAGRSARTSASRYYESGRSYMRGAGHSGSESFRGAMRRGQRGMESARRGGERTLSYFEEQPLLAGLLGVSVGAVIGALLPTTRYEDEYLGGVRDQFVDDVQHRAARAVDGVGRVASEMARAGRDAAERENIGVHDPHDTVRGAAQHARESARDYAERARHVVEDTVQAGREAAEREAGMTRSGASSDTSHDERRTS
jgi:ElaB/YqjD/DUF883 family membrane-anchored ribosome-binding protein